MKTSRSDFYDAALNECAEHISSRLQTAKQIIDCEPVSHDMAVLYDLYVKLGCPDGMKTYWLSKYFILFFGTLNDCMELKEWIDSIVEVMKNE